MSVLNRFDFHYDLPTDLIAQQPLADRTGSRLLIRNRDGEIQHEWIKNLARILPANTHLVFNDTRVVPGRLIGHSAHGGKIEIMLLRPIDAERNSWLALGRPFKKLKVGSVITFAADVSAEILEQNQDSDQPSLVVGFNVDQATLFEWMEQEGYIPLPPYIARKDATTAHHSEDRQRYQTVYAQERGSVAAPTAGLHFSTELWSELSAAGIVPVPLTLHVGGGTFLPVKTIDLADHTMHSEAFRLNRQSYDLLLAAQAKKAPIVAVGTTSLRCLESFSRLQGPRETALNTWHETNLFLYPKDRTSIIKPWLIDGIITNFHQPESSLLMLVAALIGYDAMQSLYQEAIRERYRFLSYGDTSLLWL